MSSFHPLRRHPGGCLASRLGRQVSVLLLCSQLCSCFLRGWKQRKTERFPDSVSFHPFEIWESWFCPSSVMLRFFSGLVRRKLRALSFFLFVWVIRQFSVMKLITMIFRAGCNSWDWTKYKICSGVEIHLQTQVYDLFLFKFLKLPHLGPSQKQCARWVSEASLSPFIIIFRCSIFTFNWWIKIEQIYVVSHDNLGYVYIV